MKIKALYAIAFIFQIYKLVKTKQSIRYCKKLINTLRSLESLGIKSIQEKVSEGILKIGETILCKGQLVAGQAMKSLLKPQNSVAYSQLIIQKVLEIGESRNRVRKTLRKLYSSVLKLQQDGESAHIYESMASNIIPSKIIKKTVSFKYKLFNFSWLLSLFIKSPTRIASNVYIESYFPNLAQGTVFGQLNQNSKKQIQFYRPIAIASSKDRIIRFYKNELQNLTFLQYFISFTLIVTVLVTLKFVVQPFFQKRNVFQPKQKSTLQKIKQVSTNDRNCSICHTIMSNVINHPCLHLSVCSDCNLNLDQCVECRSKPSQNIVVYPC